MTAATALRPVDRVHAVLAAFGFSWDTDYDLIRDVCVGYAEPGYSSDPDVPVVLGNWNSLRRSYRDAPTYASERPARLADALASVGAECEWSDEWARCEDCSRAVRTSADSYGWVPSYVWDENGGGYICAECARADVETYLEDYIGDATRAVTWCGPAELASVGFVPWEPDDPQTYDTGWHPGQTDDPHAVLSEILSAHPGADVVFRIIGTGQFDVRWSAYIRTEHPEE
jgi:hypothetical protein